MYFFGSIVRGCCSLSLAIVLPFATGATYGQPPAPFPVAPRGAIDDEAVVRADRERYSGTWRVVSIEANGEVSSDDNRLILVENRLDGSWTLSVDGREVSRGTSTMDPLAVPKEIDLEITAGDGTGSILKGIYEVGEKTRRLCFRGGNGWRPREFSGAAGSDSVLIVFERQ